MKITGSCTYNPLKQSVCDIDGYEVITEAPLAQGGSGQYPPATRLVLAALINCKMSALGAFCVTRGIDTKNLRVDFSADFEKGMYNALNLTVHVPSDFPEKYMNTIESTLDTCTVERIIRHFPAIDLEVNKMEVNINEK